MFSVNYHHRSILMSNGPVERYYPAEQIYDARPVEVYADFLTIHTLDPYMQGHIHGEVLQQKIQFIFQKGAKMIEELGSYVLHRTDLPDIPQMGMQIINNSKDAHIQELKGLADGAGLPFEQVAVMNALPIVCSSFMGCTGLCAKDVHGQTEIISADNASQTFNITEDRRSQIVKRKFDETHSFQDALEVVNCSKTIRSKIFHPGQKSVDVTMGIENAATLTYQHFTQEMLFESASVHGLENPSFCLAHNLDLQGWGTGQIGYNPFGENQLILVREHANGMKTASFTFPGIIGITEGMNSHGVSISCLTQSAIRNNPFSGGEHNHFAFYDALTQSTTATQFLNSLEPRCLAGPLNLIGCDTTTAFSLEWHKAEAEKKGWDWCSKTNGM